MKKLTLLLVTTLLVSASSAQTIFSKPPPDLVHFDRGVTLTLLLPSFMTSPHGNMSSLLVKNGYPQLPKSSLNLGIGLAYRFNKLESGFDFTIGNQSSTNELLQSEILRRPTNATIFLQYHLFRSGYLTFFPIIGLSMSDTNVIASKQSSTNDIGILLQNPGTSVNMQHVSAGLLTGFGVASSQFWEEDPGTLRLKFGYRVPLGPGYAWESYFADITSPSPVDNLPYFLIQLEIGFSGNWNKGGF